MSDLEANTGIIYGYARVSTNSQKRDGTSLTSQIKLLKANGATTIISETMSGANAKRPQLTELLATLKQGDTLLIYRFDRLARNTKHLLEIVDELQQKGIYFKSLSENIDTTTPMGKMFLAVIGAIAEFERNIIKERTEQGRQRYVELGGKLGRKGHDKDRLQHAKELLISGKRYAEVSKLTGISRQTLYRHFKVDDIDEQRPLNTK